MSRYETLRAVARRYVGRTLRRSIDPDDLVQSVIRGGLAGGDRQSTTKALAHRVRMKAIDKWRKLRPGRAALESRHLVVSDSAPRRVDDSDQARALLLRVHGLPSEERAVFRLLARGLPYSAIARSTGLSVDQVRLRVLQGATKLSADYLQAS